MDGLLITLSAAGGFVGGNGLFTTEFPPVLGLRLMSGGLGGELFGFNAEKDFLRKEPASTEIGRIGFFTDEDRILPLGSSSTVRGGGFFGGDGFAGPPCNSAFCLWLLVATTGTGDIFLPEAGDGDRLLVRDGGHEEPQDGEGDLLSTYCPGTDDKGPKDCDDCGLLLQVDGEGVLRGETLRLPAYVVADLRTVARPGEDSAAAADKGRSTSGC